MRVNDLIIFILQLYVRYTYSLSQSRIRIVLYYFWRSDRKEVVNEKKKKKKWIGKMKKRGWKK